MNHLEMNRQGAEVAKRDSDERVDRGVRRVILST